MDLQFDWRCSFHCSSLSGGDLFGWEPGSEGDEQYDLVSFTFWLSHVPATHVDEFLARVYRATRPGGTVWMVDSRRASTSTARDQSVDHGGDLQERILNDGRVFEIVKIYYDSDRLRELFERAGFIVEANETPNYFVYAMAKRPE